MSILTPNVPVFPEMRRYSFQLESQDISRDNIRAFDCVVVGTNHDDFDYEMILENAQLIVDARGVYERNDINAIHA